MTNDTQENDPSILIPRRRCEGCGLDLPPARHNRRYHDNACKQEGYRRRKLKAMEEFLQEACSLLNSYADIVTWDDELSESQQQLYARINTFFGKPFTGEVQETTTN